MGKIKNMSKYKKEVLAESKAFIDKKDLVMAVLGDEEYSIQEANDMIKEYLKGKVK